MREREKEAGTEGDRERVSKKVSKERREM